jgi:hypothetical protein
MFKLDSHNECLDIPQVQILEVTKKLTVS